MWKAALGKSLTTGQAQSPAPRQETLTRLKKPQKTRKKLPNIRNKTRAIGQYNQ
jgi:hypothetical protein